MKHCRIVQEIGLPAMSTVSAHVNCSFVSAFILMDGQGKGERRSEYAFNILIYADFA